MFLRSLTTEAMRTCGLREQNCRTEILVMRAQNLRNARQPAGVHRRVLGAGRSVVIQSSFVIVELIYYLSIQYVCFVSCLFLSAS